ncbi:M20 family metallopeptidase [Desulfomicrobium sp. ZS1]|uniref:M20 family metallopeptidase n=1 Tax=Desulfomicrobium sp. ZS1 TaxID=2952228 RepID=UPI0020B26043|nr:M20 family metallopeptidase [Desulfomicrobium sp. ZS1]UTF50334.1 M20 family metallopeptidase [Desulfomicrobium sp. ZS1]
MHDVILSYLEPRRREALDLLRRLVEIQSGSRNKPGLDRMAVDVAEVLGGILPEVRILPFAEHGNMVQVMTSPAARGEKGIVLVGHMDTVFPADTDFTAFRENDERCHGPGVYDMKGGLVVAIYALKALAHLGLLENIPVTVLCNSDEEIGSPASRPWIEEQAKGALAALVFEGGGANNDVVTGRKGRLGMHLTVRGRAGHAAKGGAKASAILELAHKIIALEGLNDGREITLNVGQITGGIGPNTVPELATATLDARFLTPDGQQRLEQSLARIAEHESIAGTSTTLTVQSGRPAMPQSEGNRRLWAIAREQARILGYELPDELRSGVSDANFIAGLGVPVLDGLGPVGDLDHSDLEFILKNSLTSRAALTAATITAIWNHAQSG